MPALIEAEVIGVGAAADGEQDVRADDRRVRPSSQSTPTAMHLLRAGSKWMHSAFRRTVDAFRFQNLLDGCGDVFVLVRDQARAFLDDGDFAAEAAEHLPELQADVAAADDHQVARQDVELDHGAVGEIGDGRATPGMSGTMARPPTLMKICSAVRRSSPTRISCGRFEAGVAFEDGAVLHAVQPAFEAGARLAATTGPCGP